jgi:hypothetical protein
LPLLTRFFPKICYFFRQKSQDLFYFLKVKREVMPKSTLC